MLTILSRPEADLGGYESTDDGFGFNAVTIEASGHQIPRTTCDALGRRWAVGQCFAICSTLLRKRMRKQVMDSANSY
jgi:hypothetical protein